MFVFLSSDIYNATKLAMTLEIANARLSASHAIERLWAPAHRRTFGGSAQKRGIRDVVLLAMGGGSFGPVLRASFGSSQGFPGTLAQAQAAGDIQALAPRTPTRRPTMRRTRSGRARKK